MDVLNQISHKIAQTITKIYGVNEEVTLQPTRKDFEGDYTFVFFGLVKSLKKSPPEIGNALGTYLLENFEDFESYNVVQGFLNLKLKNSFWLNVFKNVISENIEKDIPENAPAVMV